MRKLTLMIIFFTCCSFGGEMILKFSDVQFFKIRETKSDPTISLEVSGLAFHSAMAVKETKVITEGNTETVFVDLTPAKKGLSGSFVFEFSVPNNIDIVQFGPDKHLIWKRGLGPMEGEKTGVKP
jgi:hypothetical protein